MDDDDNDVIATSYDDVITPRVQTSSNYDDIADHSPVVNNFSNHSNSINIVCRILYYSN